MKLKDILK